MSEKGKVSAYLFNLSIGTVIANFVLFPGIAWVFYHSKAAIDGAVVATEVFFGGVVCTLIVGITGHLEAASKSGGCQSCEVRGNCPFLGIFLWGLVLGTICVTVSHLVFGNDPVTFRNLMIAKVVQGIFLGLTIPVILVQSKLLLHPQVNHPLCATRRGG